MQLYQIGWCPDYNDPSNYINQLMSNSSKSNTAQVNDPWLQTVMVDALAETDPVARQVKYSAMQHYIMDELMPWVFLYNSLSKASWSIHLGNVPRNPLGKLYFYPCTWDSTTTSMTSPSSDTFPTNPLKSIVWNVNFLLLAFLGITMVLIFQIRKFLHRNNK